MWHDPIIDRRLATRWPLAGVLVVRMRGRSLRTRIIDLSTTGARLRVESMTGLDDFAGCDVGIELRLDGNGSKWLYLRGRVMRVSRSLLTLVIAFDHAPTEFADLVANRGTELVDN